MLLLHSTPKTVPPFGVITDGTSLDQDIQDVRQIIASAVEQVRPIMDTRRHQLTVRDSSVAGYEVTIEHSAKDAPTACLLNTELPTWTASKLPLTLALPVSFMASLATKKPPMHF